MTPSFLLNVTTKEPAQTIYSFMQTDKDAMKIILRRTKTQSQVIMPLHF